MVPGNVLSSNFGERSDLQVVRQGLLDGHLVLRGELHEEDVHDVESEEDQCIVELNFVSVEEHRDGDKVDQDENRFSSNDPPIDESLRRHDQIKDTYTRQKLISEKGD